MDSWISVPVVARLKIFSRLSVPFTVFYRIGREALVNAFSQAV